MPNDFKSPFTPDPLTDAALPDDGRRWVVSNTTALGKLREGTIVGPSDLQPGADLHSLVSRGYLVPAENVGPSR